MAVAAKALWRNSACLVLGSGPIQYLPKSLISDPSGLLCKSVKGSSPSDSEFLFVKRSLKAGFMVWVYIPCLACLVSDVETLCQIRVYSLAPSI